MTDKLTEEIQKMADEGKPKAPPEAPAIFKPDEKRQAAFPYSHAAMIDLIIANPGWGSKELSKHFGFTPGWFSQVVATDEFQLQLDSRRHEVANPALVATLEERFRGLTLHSLEKLQTLLENPKVQDQTVLKAAELGIKALGLGQKKPDEDDPSKEIRTLDTLADRLTQMFRERGGKVLQQKPGLQEVPLTIEQSLQEVPNA